MGAGVPGAGGWAERPGGTVAGMPIPRRYTTDASSLGRGVYVDGVRVASQQGVVLDGEQHPEDFVAQGWTQSPR